ncbi:glycosyltransferase family 2 protein [Paracoccaceae bacterium Fryx2]|nr:glycosyltransferase family 2 protein [Paracoccaceae bacterium Fryx2]
MADWGLCTTVKAPAEQVLAFVAHHLGLGAARLWLYFDDPEDPAAGALAGLDRVTVIRCDADWWKGDRPEAHQNRQGRNMKRTWRAARLPWVGHIDVDEFLLPDAPIARALAAVPGDQPQVRLAPWEALHDPALPDDIFTARHFRAQMGGAAQAANRIRVFGPYAPLLPSGMLSHSAGKCFFRTGVPGLQPRLHGAFIAGQRLDGGDFHPGIALLHFHAEDPARWKHRLQFRLTRGAYKFNPALQAHLAAADAGGIDAFFDRVQTPSPECLALLGRLGLLRTTRLGLREKVAALTGA